MRFSVLGPLEVFAADGPIELTASKQRLLLAILIHQDGIPISTGALIEALWNGKPPASTHRAFAWHLLQLRNALGDKKRIVHRGDGYRLVAESGELDHRVFEAKKCEAESQVDTDPGRASALLAEGLDLWRGPAYGDLADGPLRDEANRLDELRLASLELRYRLELGLGNHASLISELTTLIAGNPFRDELRRQLMLALYRTGRQSDALEVFRQGRRQSIDELGLEPGPALRKLEKQILANDPELHRSEPDASHTSKRPPVHSQLPADTSAFTGREDEVSTVVATARTEGSPGTIVVSAIDGMAGVGKTALAVHTAHRLADAYPDGQLFINMHGYSDGVDPVTPDEALDRLLRTVGVPQRQLPSQLNDKAALWRDRLAGKQVLIVIDNVESEQQVRHLQPGGTHQLVLVTSRRRLPDLDGARRVHLDVLPRRQAAEMFIRSAQIEPRGETDSQHIEEICRHCGFLPLAIRIAAAKLRNDDQPSLSELSKALRPRSDQLPELTVGDRSVSSAFALSYEALSPDERRILRLMATIPGPDINARAVAAGAGLPLKATQDCLDSLATAHLIEASADRRYGLHDLVRQYARSLDESEVDLSFADALERVHDYYLYGAHQAMGRIYGQPPHLANAPQVPSDLAWTMADEHAAQEWCEHERANIEAMLDFTIDIPSDRIGWPLFVAFEGYLMLHERGRQLNGFAHRFRDRLDGTDQVFGLASVERAVGVSYAIASNLDEAARHLHRSQQLWRSINDEVGESTAVNSLALICRQQGRYEESIEIHERAIELASRHDRLKTIATMYESLGRSLWVLGHISEALEAFERSLRQYGEIGNTMGPVNIFTALSELHSERGDYDQAIHYGLESLAVATENGYTTDSIRSHVALGEAHMARGDHQAGLKHHRIAVDLARDHGDVQFAIALVTLGAAEQVSGLDKDAERHLLEGIEFSRSIDQGRELMLGHQHLSNVYLDRGDKAGAVAALNEAKAAADTVSPYHSARIDKLLAELVDG